MTVLLGGHPRIVDDVEPEQLLQDGHREADRRIGFEGEQVPTRDAQVRISSRHDVESSHRVVEYVSPKTPDGSACRARTRIEDRLATLAGQAEVLERPCPLVEHLEDTIA